MIITSFLLTHLVVYHLFNPYIFVCMLMNKLLFMILKNLVSTLNYLSYTSDKQESCVPIQGLHPSEAAFVDRLHHSGATRLLQMCPTLPEEQRESNGWIPLGPNLSQDSLRANDTANEQTMLNAVGAAALKS